MQQRTTSTPPPAPLPPLLDTLELFESILLRLDTKTLLLAQRVSRWWHRVITNSKPLQRKLFFLPTTTFDDILSLGFLDTTDTEKFNILDATSNKCKWLQQVVILNDLLFDTTREWKLKSVAFASPSPSTRPIIPSWQNMLLTQPPPSTGHGDVIFWFEDAHDNDELCQEVDTMGALIHQIRTSKERFGVHWESAAVRPVKHAVDGAYYGRLLRQRRREEEGKGEERLEVVVWDRRGEVEGSSGREGVSGDFNELGFRAERVVLETEEDGSDGS